MNARLLGSLAFGLAGALLVGCGGGDVTRYHVAGKVTWKGNPVNQGSVTFIPDTGKNASGQSGSAPITNGAYDTRNGKAPTGGAYTVRVDAFDGKGNPDAPAGNPLFFYEEKVDLPKEDTTKDFTVPANAPKTPPQSLKFDPNT